MNNDVNSNKTWTVPLVDAVDESGDVFLTFPDALLAHTGWKEGDTLSLESLGKILKISKAT